MSTDSFDNFASLLSDHFGWTAPLRPETSLVEDLEVDSLEALEIVMVLEALSGHDVPDEAAREVRTVGDLYALATVYRLHGISG